MTARRQEQPQTGLLNPMRNSLFCDGIILLFPLLEKTFQIDRFDVHRAWNRRSVNENNE